MVVCPEEIRYEKRGLLDDLAVLLIDKGKTRANRLTSRYNANTTRVT